MKKRIQPLTDKRFWLLLGLVAFIVIVPPGRSNAGTTGTKVDSVEFYRVNTLNYQYVQKTLIEKIKS